MAELPCSCSESTRQRLQLWFEQFRDLAFIELARAGGVITLLGTVFHDSQYRGRAMVSVAFLSLAGTTALIAQSRVVDLSDEGQPPDNWLRRLRAASLTLRGGRRAICHVHASHAGAAIT